MTTLMPQTTPAVTLAIALILRAGAESQLMVATYVAASPSSPADATRNAKHLTLEICRWDQNRSLNDCCMAHIGAGRNVHSRRQARLRKRSAHDIRIRAKSIQVAAQRSGGRCDVASPTGRQALRRNRGLFGLAAQFRKGEAQ